MTLPLALILLACVGVFGLFLRAITSRPNEGNADEWVFVPYKDTHIPMRVWQKEMQWDKMSGEEKRKVYLDQKRMIEKGELKKVFRDDGHFLLETTKKSSAVKKEALNYEKLKKQV